MNKYKIVNDTAYCEETPDDLIEVLEYIRRNKIRVVFDYGDTTTGKLWGEVNDIRGTIGRSTGKYKIPLLIKTSRSIGGGGILTNCIVGIKHSVGGKSLYSISK